MVKATDPNGDPLALSVSFPSGPVLGASFVDNGNNTGTFTLPTLASDVGKIYFVTFTATDAGGLSDVQPISISVVQPRPPCFIATAAYGSSSNQNVEILRALRERILKFGPAGENFVNFYYQVSPPIAKTIEGSVILQRTVTFLLKPLVAFTKTFIL